MSLEAGSDCEKPSVDIEGEFGHERKEEDIFEGNDGTGTGLYESSCFKFCITKSFILLYSIYFHTPIIDNNGCP